MYHPTVQVDTAPGSLDPTFRRTMIQKYVDYSVRCEEIRSWLAENVPPNQSSDLYAATQREFEGNPDKYPSAQPDRTDTSDFWFKCDKLCAEQPTTPLQHMLQFFAAFRAMKIVQDIEFGDSDGNELISSVNNKILQILQERQLAPSTIHRPAPSREGALLQWVGQTFTVQEDGVAKQYEVKDSVTSAMKGSYYVLEDVASHATIEVSVDEFADMVDSQL